MANFNMVYSGSVVLQWQVQTLVGPFCMEFTLLASMYHVFAGSLVSLTIEKHPG